MERDEPQRERKRNKERKDKRTASDFNKTPKEGTLLLGEIKVCISFSSC